MKYICSICGYVYDEAKEGTPFDGLPDVWACPVCGAGKSAFAVKDQNDKSGQARETAANSGKRTACTAGSSHDGDMEKLSPGVMAAICSNLARGCEKQYKDREAGLYRRIADYFASIEPDEADADMEKLSGLIRDNLQEGYPVLRVAAEAEKDRGTLRICTWGEKVTNILNSLIQRYEREGENFLKDTQIWVCTVCGFVYVGDQAPDLCPVCKVPAWKFEKMERRGSA